mmetsp:Transcript_4918/g.4172  ORF Transcript_4918/g.4172 Transcript_4918/m.4172 type:complete len:93 (+) Transcript_4918:276-554(+)
MLPPNQNLLTRHDCEYDDKTNEMIPEELALHHWNSTNLGTPQKDEMSKMSLGTIPSYSSSKKKMFSRLKSRDDMIIQSKNFTEVSEKLKNKE